MPISLEVTAASHSIDYGHPHSVQFIKKRYESWLLVLFLAVFGDSLLVYHCKNLLGWHVPTNAFVPPVLVYTLYRFKGAFAMPQPRTTTGLFLIICGLALGVWLNERHPVLATIPILGALGSFFVGHCYASKATNGGGLAAALFWVSVAYVGTCAFALSGVAPGIFPVIEMHSFRGGELHIRHEITTDQNFQIFTLFPICFGLFFNLGRVALAISLAGIISTVYVIFMMASRSAALLFLGALLVLAAFALSGRSISLTRMLIAPIVLVVLIVMGGSGFIEAAEHLTARFSDLAGEGMGDARSGAVELFIQYTFDWKAWAPLGQGQFLEMIGNVPHFTPLGFLLRGGLPALIGYLLIVPLPLAMLWIRAIGERAEPLKVIVLVGGTILMLGQLSLDLVIHDHLWLWAGSVAGYLSRPHSPIATFPMSR